MTGPRSLGALLSLSLLAGCGGSGGGGISTANRAPTITGSPTTTVNVGTAYSFQPSASDPDGDPLTFTIQGKPSWLQFDGATGALAGTPSVAHLGTHTDISITANDGRASSTLTSFSVTVIDAGRPQISGSPPTRATVGQPYSFTPQAIDPDAQNNSDAEDLTFSIRNRPSWASFDPVLGRLFGTPNIGHVGDYSRVRISVSDGTYTESLPEFSINVEAQSSGQVTVSWAAPTQNADGSPLTDLAGFLIFFGQSGADLVQNRTVSGVGITSLVIDNLAAGTWYFQMSSYNSNNIESARTPVVSHTVP
jgi:hypothetical protein